MEDTHMADQDKIEALRQEYAGLKYSSGQGDGAAFLSVPKLHHVFFQDKDGNEIKSPGIIADLQAASVRILSSGDIPSGTDVAVTLEIQKDAPITITGKVQWSNEVTYLANLGGALSHIQAIGFVDLPEDVINLIEQFLAYKNNLTVANMVDKILEAQG